MIIKVCGMRDADNLRQVSKLGIDWIGFIFYPKSPRYIPDGEYPLFDKDKNRKAHPKTVGVFVNASHEYILEIYDKYRLDFIQLHGNESPEFCHTLQKRDVHLIKAFPIAESKDLIHTTEYEGRVDYFLFDTKCIDFGGSGRSFNWSVLNSYKGETPFILSGGIKPESLDAVKTFSHLQLAGIDLNSGFETKPGLKNIEKLRDFLCQLRINH